MAFENVKTEDLLSLVSNITEDSIIEALKYIDKNGIPPRREAYSSFIQYKDKEYPLKYVFEVTNNFILKNPKKIGHREEFQPDTWTIETVLRKLLPNPQSIKILTPYSKDGTNLIESLRNQLLSFAEDLEIEKKDDHDYTMLKLENNIAKIHGIQKNMNRFDVYVKYDILTENLIQKAKIKKINKNDELDGHFYIQNESNLDVAKEIISHISHIYETEKETHMNTELNQILYGPPGTGKTFSTIKLVEDIIKSQINGSLDEITKINNIFEKFKVNWYQALAIAMYGNGKDKYKVAELRGSNEIKAYLLGRTNNSIDSAIWNNLQVHTNPDVTTVKCSQYQTPYLFEKTKNSYWFLTQEGKEYVENELSDVLEDLKVDKTAEISDFREFITFHQSYSYEEFVEGIKPYEKENGDIGYKVEDGIFKKICAKAKANPKWNYVLVIDEINRGNIAKIFGELITLIEHDKRLGAKNGLEVTLPYSKTLFGVPKNLYIIGTMNTADKSLALLDVALRRRFDFIPMYPKYEIEGKTIHYSEFLRDLNKKIYNRKKQNADYLIGHSYFMDDEKTPKLKDILNKKVIPLLMEYFNNNKDTVEKLLKEVDKEISFNEGIYHLEVK